MMSARRNNQSGFSLLELIVVIAMMATLTGVIVPRLNLGGDKRIIRTETLRLAELMQRASDEAIFKTREVGIRFTDRDYQFLTLDGDNRTGKWVAYESTLFRKREWPESFDIEVELSGVGIELEASEAFKIDKDTRPHVLFLSNGELMPDFKVLVDRGLSDERWQVATGVDQPVTVGIVEE